MKKTEVEIIIDEYCKAKSKDDFTCMYVKKAINRFIADKKRIKEDSWDYILDWDYVQQFYKFSKSIKLPDSNNYLNLLPWQLFCIANLLGWKYKLNTEKRRFRSGTIYVPRKNGKTTGFMYPLLLWDLITTESSESYLFAKDDTQALHFLNDIKKIISEDTDLSKNVTTSVSTINLKKSKISCFSSETVGIDGYKPSLAVIDEYWCFKNERCVTAMRYGGRARLNSLVLIITTAGLDISLSAYTEYEKVKKILNGILTDDTYFGIIYEADSKDDWKSPDSYIKANPSIDTILDRKILEQDLQDALITPSHQSDYKAKTLNIWTNETSNWIPLQKWLELKNTLPIEDFKGLNCYAGLDLSSIGDFTALTLCFEKDNCYYLYHKFYVPSETINERYKHENINIKEWCSNGIVTAIPGNIIDYSYIEKDLIEYSKDYDIIEIAYDRWNSNKLIDNLDALFPKTILIQFDQSLKSLSNPTKEFERLIYEKRIKCNNPCMTWMVSNATIKPDVNGNYKPMKEGKSSTNRIDGVISSLMALSRCIANESNIPKNKDFNSILKLF